MEAKLAQLGDSLSHVRLEKTVSVPVKQGEDSLQFKAGRVLYVEAYKGARKLSGADWKLVRMAFPALLEAVKKAVEDEGERERERESFFQDVDEWVAEAAKIGK